MSASVTSGFARTAGVSQAVRGLHARGHRVHGVRRATSQTGARGFGQAALPLQTTRGQSQSMIAKTSDVRDHDGGIEYRFPAQLSRGRRSRRRAVVSTASAAHDLGWPAERWQLGAG